MADNLTSSPQHEPAASDTLIAIRNALKLGASLTATWGIALGVRLMLPRYLGPAAFGSLQFSEAFATMWFVAISLGVDTYIRKEVPLRPAHATDFFGGLMLIRIALSVALLAAMYVTLSYTHRTAEVQRLVFLFGLSQLFVNVNNTYASLLHAVGRVDGLAILNVISKLLWGVGIPLGFYFNAGLAGVAISLTFSEALKTVFLANLSRRHVQLRVGRDFTHAKAVIIASIPFYLNYLAHTVYAKVDVSMLSFMQSDTEVGWYSASSNLAGLALLLTPIIGWVLLPMSSRASMRSEDEMTLLMRRAIELILIIAIPTSLILGLGADVWVHLAFGDKFAPAVGSLRILAPMFVLTYVAMVTATLLVGLGRGWTVTAISLGGLAVNPILNYILVPILARRFGPGGGGMGAATALIITETLVTGTMQILVGRRAFDRRSLTMLAKTAVVCAVVVSVDRLAYGFASNHGGQSLQIGRVAVDCVLYVGLAVAFGVVDIREFRSMVSQALAERGKHVS